MDLFDAHSSLMLGHEVGGNRILAYLAPVREREVFVIGEEYGRLASAIAHVLSAYRKLGVQSFNLAIFMPPLGEGGRHVVRIVDRGDPGLPSSDIGAMELYARTSVVSGDPFALAGALTGKDWSIIAHGALSSGDREAQGP